MKPLFTKKNGTSQRVAAIEVTMPASYPSANVTYGSGSVEDALDALTDEIVYINDSTSYSLPAVGDSVDVTKSVARAGYTLVAVANVSPNTAKVAVATFTPSNGNTVFLSFVNLSNSSQAGQTRNATWTNVFKKQ